MTIDVKMIKQLREETGAGMMECKSALEESNGDMPAAHAWLVKKGVGRAEKLSKKETKEGRIGSYIHTTGKIGAMIELTCETDFVAKNDEFLDLMKELALGVCAFDPVTVGKDDLPAELVEAEKAKYETETEGKPPEIAVKIIEGKLEKNLFSQKCLMHMPFPKEDKFKGTYGGFLASKVAILKENITLRRFHRFELGG
jgi:elongation factor Ts